MSFKIRINKTELLIFLLLLASIKIDSFTYVFPDIIATAFNYWLPLCVCGYALLILLTSRRQVSPIMKMFGVFVALFFVCTALKSPGNIWLLTVQISPLLAVTLVTEIYMRSNPGKYLNAVVLMLFILIIIDIISMFLYPNGVYTTVSYTENWFLGYKTSRLRLATLPIIMIEGIISIRQNHKLNLRFWIVSVIAFVDTLFSRNTGGIVTIMMLIFMMYVMYGSKRRDMRLRLMKLFKFKVLIFVILILTAVINLFQNLSLFTFIYDLIPDKEMTMGGRLRIWQACLELFRNAPILGNGYVSSSRFIELVGFNAATQPHSLLLGILVYMGVVGVISYLLLLNKTMSYVDTRNPYATTPICAAYLLCMLIHGIISMHLFAPFMVASMVILYYLNKSDNLILA